MSKTMALVFNCQSGDVKRLSFSNPKADLTEATAKPHIDAIVTNGDAFVDKLLSVKSAVITETTKSTLYTTSK